MKFPSRQLAQTNVSHPNARCGNSRPCVSAPHEDRRQAVGWEWRTRMRTRHPQEPWDLRPVVSLSAPEVLKSCPTPGSGLSPAEQEPLPQPLRGGLNGHPCCHCHHHHHHHNIAEEYSLEGAALEGCQRHQGPVVPTLPLGVAAVSGRSAPRGALCGRVMAPPLHSL